MLSTKWKFSYSYQEFQTFWRDIADDYFQEKCFRITQFVEAVGNLLK